MKKLILSLALLLAATAAASADEIVVSQFDYVGPVALPKAVAFGDTLGSGANKPLDYAVNTQRQHSQRVSLDGVAPGYDQADALHVLAFDFENRRYGEADLLVKGLSDYKATVDGNPVAGKLKLHPGTHRAVIKYVTHPGATDSLTVTLKTDKEGLLTLPADGSRMIVLDDVMCGKRISQVSMSPSGAYLIVAYSDTDEEGHASYSQRLYDAKTLRPIATLSEWAAWMPKGDRYYVTRKSYDKGRHIVVVNPADGTETVLADNIPAGSFQIAPTEDYLVYTLTRKGRKEDPQVYEVREPEDRQPGWRDRSYPAIYRLGGDGALVPMTVGMDNVYVSDIAPDGKSLLLFTSRSRLEKRPTTVFSVINFDLAAMKADTLVKDDGFVQSAQFSPDGKKVLVKGTPEAFDRIGCVLPESVIPSMTQMELFVIDLATKQVTPITRDFNPNPMDVVWSENDGQIYLTAEDRDWISLFKIDPATGKHQQVATPEQIIKGFSLAETAPLMVYSGQSDSNPDALYLRNLKKGNNTLVDQPSKDRLKDVRLAKCEDWNFVNSRGDTIYGRFYLPDNFDPAKKYPMIVNYYGGCSPSQRTFESRYPHHVYSELGYVVYVVQPSGATGFGQEFSSRHVNTAGDGPAQDIIEGTKKFLEEHPYVDASKVGCIGASYGGFMTQYLQTITDIFAAAVSHAGISDHTSYWGEGYWGYSYSETSMAESYPWSDRDLYVKQSPLYNADKVHTPILFVHGDADHNVPVGESIQMFTALKLLGCPTALVQVADQDHHILQFDKRRKWQDTIFAWFAKYLQDDPDWWESMYPTEL